MITLAAALEEKLINPQQKIYCENGSFFIGGSVIRDVKPYAYLKLHEVLQKSSNICALKIGRLIKNKKFHQYILDFGFGKKTNIELPGEIKGTVHDYKKWSNLDKAVISYGHSISVTPIQLISAINTIANDGMYISPTIKTQIGFCFTKTKIKFIEWIILKKQLVIRDKTLLLFYKLHALFL